VIKYTKDPEVYMTERHAYNTFTYKLPLEKAKEGKLTLIFKFNEMYFTQANKRVFNLGVGNSVVKTGIDLAGKFGRYVARDEYVEIEYTGDKILFEGKEVDGAINKLN